MSKESRSHVKINQLFAMQIIGILTQAGIENHGHIVRLRGVDLIITSDLCSSMTVFK